MCVSVFASVRVWEVNDHRPGGVRLCERERVCVCVFFFSFFFFGRTKHVREKNDLPVPAGRFLWLLCWVLFLDELSKIK